MTENPKVDASPVSGETQAGELDFNVEIPADYEVSEQLQKWVSLFIKFNEVVDPKDAEAAFKKMEDFVQDKISWADVEGMPKKLLVDLSEYAYLKLNAGRYDVAEKIFRGLSVIDHKNAYYHLALGVLYQRQQKWSEALIDYTISLSLNPEDIVALTNRAEVYFQLGTHNLALEDLNQSIALDVGGKNPWANRARLLRKQVLDQIKLDAEEDAELAKQDKGN